MVCPSSLKLVKEICVELVEGCLEYEEDKCLKCKLDYTLSNGFCYRYPLNCKILKGNDCE